MSHVLSKRNAESEAITPTLTRQTSRFAIAVRTLTGNSSRDIGDIFDGQLHVGWKPAEPGGHAVLLAHRGADRRLHGLDKHRSESPGKGSLLITISLN